MDHYDSSDDEGGGGGVMGRALGGRSGGVILDDPYMQGGADSSDDEGGVGGDDVRGLVDSDEADDYVLRPSDLLLLAARSEDDVSTLELWVYEEAGSSTGVRQQRVYRERERGGGARRSAAGTGLG